MKKAPKNFEAALVEAASAPLAGLDSKSHTEIFAVAARSFSAGDFRKAKSLFDEAADGPVLSVCESARMYSRMCEQRLSREKVDLRSPEDHYNFAIGLMNSRNFVEAKEHLEVAMDGGGAPHVRYALSIVLGMLGDLEGSARELRTAFQKDPKLRVMARNDADLQPLMESQQFRNLLAGEPPAD